jgi:hypothetical protein
MREDDEATLSEDNDASLHGASTMAIGVAGKAPAHEDVASGEL